MEKKEINETLKSLSKPRPAGLHYEAAQAFFKTCPFCGEHVNVFQVPEDRYGENAPFGWTIECMSMGCIFTRPLPDQSIGHLAAEWNKRS